MCACVKWDTECRVVCLSKSWLKYLNTFNVGHFFFFLSEINAELVFLELHRETVTVVLHCFKHLTGSIRIHTNYYKCKAVPSLTGFFSCVFDIEQWGQGLFFSRCKASALCHTSSHPPYLPFTIISFHLHHPLSLCFSLTHSVKLKTDSEPKTQGTGLFQGETK